MSKLRNFVLGTVIAASMAACGPKPQYKEDREQAKKDLVETIVNWETQSDVLHIKNFNQAILNHDVEWALYNLASAYLNRSVYMLKTYKGHNAMELVQNMYGLLPQIKEFYVVFWAEEDTRKIYDMVVNEEFWWMGANSLWGAMRIILDWSETFRKGKIEK